MSRTESMILIVLVLAVLGAVAVMGGITWLMVHLFSPQ